MVPVGRVRWAGLISMYTGPGTWHYYCLSIISQRPGLPALGSEHPGFRRSNSWFPQVEVWPLRSPGECANHHMGSTRRREPGHAPCDFSS